MTGWLSRRRPVDSPGIRLYCLPHAGGSAGEYLRLTDALPGVEVWGVNLPGRGARLDEPPLADLAALVEALVDEVRFRTPFALFGHSFGALLGYEVAQRLRARDREQPDRLLVSGCPPPHLPRTEPPLSHLPDEQFVDHIGRYYGGLPPELLGDPDLLALALPALRADLAALERYVHPGHPPLERPVTVLCGEWDPVAGQRLAEWDRHTTAGCLVRLVPGGHFYFRERPGQATEVLSGSLTAPSGRPR